MDLLKGNARDRAATAKVAATFASDFFHGWLESRRDILRVR